MPRCEMPGLRADNPQGWMAAIGVLLILDRQGKKIQLGWQQEMPVLFGIELNEVIDTLVAYLHQGSKVLDDVEMLPKAEKNNKIALDFTAGQVNFANVINGMTKTVTKEHMVRALTHTWTNTDDVVSLGWDPAAAKQAATLSGHKAPDSATHRTELAGQWLAAESLAVTCPVPSSLKNGFQWVTWGVPLDMEGVYSVVQARSNEWIGAHFRSNIEQNGKFKILQPSERLRQPSVLMETWGGWRNITD